LKESDQNWIKHMCR